MMNQSGNPVVQYRLVRWQPLSDSTGTHSHPTSRDALLALRAVCASAIPGRLVRPVAIAASSTAGRLSCVAVPVCTPRVIVRPLAVLSGASLTAVDLPCPVRALDHVQRDWTGCHQRVAVMAADLSPSRMRDPGNAAVLCEPLGSANWCRLTAAV